LTEFFVSTASVKLRTYGGVEILVSSSSSLLLVAPVFVMILLWFLNALRVLH